MEIPSVFVVFVVCAVIPDTGSSYTNVDTGVRGRSRTGGGGGVSRLETPAYVAISLFPRSAVSKMLP